jgi:hypothetical protein
MTLTEFWDHVEKCRRADPDAHAERLVARLAKRPVETIVAFDHVWQTRRNRAYSWNVWGAAYLINGGCSDDGFIDFRSWLILRGRKVFDRAVKNPDALASIVDPDSDRHECECYPGMDAWFAATRTARGKGGYNAWDAARAAKYPVPPPLPPLGRGWDFDNDARMRKRYPRLAALYLDRAGDGRIV